MAEARAVEMTPDQVMRWRETVLTVLERLCKLQQEVAEQTGSYMEHAADCFCGLGGYWRTERPGDESGFAAFSWRNDGEVIALIERAVREKFDLQSPTDFGPTDSEGSVG